MSQSVSTVHVVLHAVAPQAKLPQPVVPLSVHVAEPPAQKSWLVWTPAAHDAAEPQVVALLEKPHAPEPLHAPVKQVPAGHSLAGSFPAMIELQVPTKPFTLHAWHRPPQLLLQQKPSMQLVLEH